MLISLNHRKISLSAITGKDHPRPADKHLRACPTGESVQLQLHIRSSHCDSYRRKQWRSTSLSLRCLTGPFSADTSRQWHESNCTICTPSCISGPQHLECDPASCQHSECWGPQYCTAASLGRAYLQDGGQQTPKGSLLCWTAPKQEEPWWAEASVQICAEETSQEL